MLNSEQTAACQVVPSHFFEANRELRSIKDGSCQFIRPRSNHFMSMGGVSMRYHEWNTERYVLNYYIL